MKKIKEVIAISGLSRRTLQYYDDMGLMVTGRTAENYRIYGDEDLQRLWRIILYKEMGFRLNEIRIILNSDDSVASNMLMMRAESIEQQKSEFQRILDFITKVIDYGLPDSNTDDYRNGITMVEKAKRLSERK